MIGEKHKLFFSFYSSLFFGSWTGICIYLNQLLCAVTTPDKMAVMVLCRHRQASHLLQHWQAWVHTNRSLREHGAMVHRAHQGYTMRHAWRHWQWLASSKVLQIILLPPVSNVAHKFHLCLHLCKVPRLQQCAASLQSACSHYHWWSAG